MLPCAVILATMICGAAHAPAWISLIGGATLGFLSLAERRHLRPRLAANDNLAVLNPLSVAAALLHCTLGTFAYPIGYMIRAFAP